jgi:hypothetical protein
MSISSRPAPVHDPDVCGLAPTQWEQLCGRYHVLLDPSGYSLHEPVPPAPLSAEGVAQLLSTLRAPRYRELFRDVLADLLAGDIAEIAIAVLEARHAAR